MICQTGVFELYRKDTKHIAAYSVSRAPLKSFTEDLGYLTAVEYSYFEKLRVEARIHSYLGGRYCAKKAVSTLTGERQLYKIGIERGVFDYPVVRYPHAKNIQVSISHTSDLIVCLAFGEEHQLSIDAEAIQHEKKKTLESSVTENECNLLSPTGQTNIEKLTALWTMKEALSKVLKTGMMTEFSLFELDKFDTIANEPIILSSEFKHFKQYKAISILGNPFALSLVMPRLTQINMNQLMEMIKATEGVEAKNLY